MSLTMYLATVITRTSKIKSMTGIVVVVIVVVLTVQIIVKNIIYKIRELIILSVITLKVMMIISKLSHPVYRKK